MIYPAEIAVITIKDDWSARHWFGSIVTLADAAEVAVNELQELGMEQDELHTSVAIRYRGGAYDSSSFRELRDAIPELEKRQGIESVSFSVEKATFAARLHASSSFGLSVSVEGPRAAPVYGLVTTLKRKLEPGMEMVREQPLKPFDMGNLVVMGIAVTGAGGVGYLVIRGMSEYGVDAVSITLLVLVVMMLLVGLGLGLYRERPHPPPLELVPQSEEESGPIESDGQSGPIIRTRDWLRRHPVMTLVGVLALGVVGNLIANAISG